MREDESHEFKRIWTPEACKEVGAFANTIGGTVLVEVEDDGTVIGLKNQEEECTRISNSIRDAIEPDAAMLVRCTAEDDGTIRVAVSEGSNKPYYIRSKGCNPKGVFVRHGSTSIPASMEQIRRLIRDSERVPFEDVESLDQELTFTQAASAFQRAHEDFGTEKHGRLGIIRPGTTTYTNTGLLLSDQCRHTIKIAVFEDSARTVFHDRREFQGSVAAQFEDAFAFLDLNNATHAEIHAAHRVEHRDYPPEAIREALVNAIIHREYSYAGSIIVNVSSQQMEFISLGGIPADLQLRDIENGVSVPRNRNLAEVFHRLHLIEGYGTGIRRIMESYSGTPVVPSISATPNSFRMVLPNRNSPRLSQNAQVLPDGDNPAGLDISADMRNVLSYASERGSVTAAQIAELLKCGKSRSYEVLRKMRDLGLLTVVQGQRGRYTAAVGMRP